MQSWFPWTVPLFAGFLFTPDFQITPSPSCSKVSISLCYALSPRVNETLPLPESPPLSLSLSARKQSELDSLKPYVVRGWIVSLPCPIPFDPRWKNRLPVCSWLVVTPLDFWVCMEGGQEVENFSPPFPPLHACLHTLPPSSSSHWPLSIVPAGPQRALSANQSGFQWGRRSWVAFYGVERGGGGSWWSWSWGGGSMASMSRHVCSLPPSARHKHTRTKACRQTHTQEVSCYGHQLSPSVTLVFY